VPLPTLNPGGPFAGKNGTWGAGTQATSSHLVSGREARKHPCLGSGTLAIAACQSFCCRTTIAAAQRPHSEFLITEQDPLCSHMDSASAPKSIFHLSNGALPRQRLSATYSASAHSSHQFTHHESAGTAHAHSRVLSLSSTTPDSLCLEKSRRIGSRATGTGGKEIDGERSPRQVRSLCHT
jgi:hypothetical protein